MYIMASQATTRIVPTYLQQTAPVSSNKVTQMAKIDGVYSYACTVLCDGLLLFELRNAFHSGDRLKLYVFVLQNIQLPQICF